MLTAKRAIKKLATGNRRFVEGRRNNRDVPLSEQRGSCAQQQFPFAMIHCCADSRVVPELIFDQGLGSLFVSRVLGHAVGPNQLATMEYAATKLNIGLIVVLGNTRSEAVATTIDSVTKGQGLGPTHVQSSLERLLPPVKAVLRDNTTTDPMSALSRANRAYLEEIVAQITESSQFLRERAIRGDLTILGAEYCLDTGVVHFLEPSE